MLIIIYGYNPALLLRVRLISILKKFDQGWGWGTGGRIFRQEFGLYHLTASGR